MDGPGPGAYHQTTHSSRGASAVFTTGRDSSQKPTVDGPGPGAYFTNVSIKDGPAYTMSSSRQTEQVPGDGPGPAAYAPNVASKTPAYGFGTAGAGPSAIAGDSITPGPGAYLVDSSANGGCSFAGRPKDSVQSVTPGPGAYDQRKRGKVGARAYSFGSKDCRGAYSVTAMQYPGPGAYSLVDSRVGPSATIGLRKVTTSADRDVTPGPGTYYNPGNSAGIAYSCGPQY